MKKYCRIIKDWGGFVVGHELWIGEPKAGNLKEQGFVEFIAPPKKKPKVETATAKPKAESTTVEPNPVDKPEAKPKRRGRPKKDEK